MKTRMGFVSNSSSSSFVAIGFKLPEKYNQSDLRDKVKTFNEDYGKLEAKILHVDGDVTKLIVGFLLEENIMLSDIWNHIGNLAEELKFESDEAQVFSGERMV
jgi:hypothetical protein